MKHIEEEITLGATLTVAKKNCGRDYISAHIVRRNGSDVCGLGVTVDEAMGCLDRDLATNKENER